MKCKFVVGQQVVCTKTERWEYHCKSQIYPPPAALPFNGEIYTIKEIMALHDDIYLRFVELEPYVAFHYIHFRPIDDTKIKKSTKIRELA